MRLQWVDNLKGIGILLVVYGHVYKGLVSAALLPNDRFYHTHIDMIYSVHMPLFFFVAGLFVVKSLEQSGKTLFILNKIDSIVYPYFLWSIIQLSCKLLMSGHVNRSVELEQFISIIWAPVEQFWFLYTIFLILLASYFLLDGFKSRVYLMALFGLSVVLYLFQDLVSFNFQLRSFSRYFVFFMLGVLLNSLDYLSSKMEKKWLAASIIVALAAHYLFFLRYQLDVWRSHAPTLLISLLSIYALIMISKAISETRFIIFERLGQASLAIYLIHILTGSGVRIILDRLLHVHDAAIHLIVGCLFGLAIPYIVFRLAQKFHANYLFYLPISKHFSAARDEK